ncbi:MAG: winged helix-turn-helix transcriptional regulator [Myxococcota bacterium]
MPRFRYPQLCALARAVEIVGERWTLLILRDLFSGPLRFGELRSRLRGITPSVLAERLRALEGRGLVRRSWLDPPAACTLYELTPAGRDLEPALVELTRWGARFLFPTRPAEAMEPAWAALALRAFARRGATPRGTIELRIPDGRRERVIRVQGGRRGTRVLTGGRRADLVVSTPVETLMALLSGGVEPASARASGALRASGDLELLDRLPELFDFPRGARVAQQAAAER